LTEGKIRLLLIEDDAADAKLLRRMLLERAAAQFDIEHVVYLEEGLNRLKSGNIDAILLDLSLPDAQGLEGFYDIHKSNPSVPLLVLTGFDDESVALEAVRAGAQDYLVKGKVNSTWLQRAVLYAIQRKAAEEQIRHLNQDLERRIDELAKLNRELGLIKDQALVTSHVKSEFVAKMSHEIRTPISAVVSILDLLSATMLSAEQEELISLFNEATDSLLAIINEVLDFSKIEAGKVTLESLDFSPSSLVESVADIVISAARKKGLTLLTFIDPSIPARVKGDPARLREVLLNFAANAIKFSEKGQILIRASLEMLRELEATIRFDVIDDGPGISSQGQEQLFQPFVQIAGAQKGGTGLGLAISKRLIDLMGGKIGVDSKVDKGTTFWFTVPLLCPDATATVIEPQSMSSGKVLVVGDNPSEYGIIARYLQVAGYLSERAETSADAIRLLHAGGTDKDNYDVVIVGFSQIAEDSIELLRKIRSDSSIPQAKLILLADLDARDKREKALKLGFSARLVRPIKRLQLMDHLVALLDTTEAEPAEGKEFDETQSGVSTDTAKSISILLVEDSPLQRKLLFKQLEKLGLNVDIVTNGREAVEAASNRLYDLILMDWQMPELDGLEATKQIREVDRARNRRTPIVALTARALDSDRDQCLEAGMDDYVRKPVGRAQLGQLLARWVYAGVST
jgi:two-component system, sensor histidine kinase and response regulator